jgi:hypothetical protein
MKLNRDFIRLVFLTLALSGALGSRKVLKQTGNDEKTSHRQKRFLIFPNGGTAKFVGEIFLEKF